MLELIICSTLTILPDYLYRRYVQGKRLGKEITFFSVWFELRYGIIACLMLTVSLITLIFYFHPSTSSATVFFRTVPISTDNLARRQAETPLIAPFRLAGPALVESTITCPHCAMTRMETMPTNACQFFGCTGCGTKLKPKSGDCCVFCSYGSVPCPPIQLSRAGGPSAVPCCS